MLRFAITMVLLVAALGVSATASHADRYGDCYQSEDRDRQMAGCTQIIERGRRERRTKRAAAHAHRGVAYYLQGELDLAVADYDSAISMFWIVPHDMGVLL